MKTRRAFGWTIALAIAPVTACSLIVDTGGLVGPDVAADGATRDAPLTPVDAAVDMAVADAPLEAAPARSRKRRRIYSPCRHPSRRARCASARGPPRVRAPPAHRPGADHPRTGRPRAHRAEASLFRRYGRHRPRSALAAVPAGGLGSCAANAHGPLRGRPRKREQAAPAHRPEAARGDLGCANEPKRQGCRYRSWAELLGTLGIDALECPSCKGRMRILALVREPNEVRRFLRAAGEVAVPPHRAPARGPPYWASRALRIRSRSALGRPAVADLALLGKATRTTR